MLNIEIYNTAFVGGVRVFSDYFLITRMTIQEPAQLLQIPQENVRLVLRLRYFGLPSFICHLAAQLTLGALPFPPSPLPDVRVRLFFLSNFSCGF
jgi:hypothetical protein